MTAIACPMRRLVLGALLFLSAAAAAHDDHDSVPEMRITAWQDGIEAFIAHEPLIAGSRVRLTAYLTWLEGYVPVETGRLEARLVPAGGETVSARVEGPLGDGVFLLGLPPLEPGTHRLDLELAGPGGAEPRRASLPLEVNASEAQISPAREEDGITYTKAQQRLIPFASEAAAEEPIAPRLIASARIEPAPGHELSVLAPARGRLRAPEGESWPRPGSRVDRGQILALLEPLGAVEDAPLAANEAELARLRLKLTEGELRRVRQLVEEGIAPERRLAEAEAEAASARSTLAARRARLAALEDRSEAEPLPLRSPLAGVVAESPLAPGQHVESGTPVLTVVDDQRLAVRVELLAADLVLVHDPRDLWLRRPGTREWVRLGTPALLHRRVRAEGPGIVSLLYALPDAATEDEPVWLPGLPVMASLATEAARPRLTVPETAILDDDGVPIVMVQLGGETFERRPIRTGIRAGGRVAVLRGLEPGERVVSRGAYAVMLAGRDPADHDHGHAH